MQLRLPGGSGGILGSLLDFSETPTSLAGTSNSITEGVQPDHVTAAIDALAAGHVEYVGLDDDAGGIQVAEMPDGYLLQRSLDGGENWVDYPGPLTLDNLRTTFLAFLAGDVTAGLTWRQVEERPAKQKRGWLRRG